MAINIKYLINAHEMANNPPKIKTASSESNAGESAFSDY
jgi:hypothetical protein